MQCPYVGEDEHATEYVEAPEPVEVDTPNEAVDNDMALVTPHVAVLKTSLLNEQSPVEFTTIKVGTADVILAMVAEHIVTPYEILLCCMRKLAADARYTKEQMVHIVDSIYKGL